MEGSGGYVKHLGDIGGDNESLTEESGQVGYVNDSLLGGADNEALGVAIRKA